MTFFDDFASLGYSAITLLVAFIFVGVLIFATAGLGRRPVWMRALLVVVMAAAFIATIPFLAQERRVMMEELKKQGGPKLRKRNTS